MSIPSEHVEPRPGSQPADTAGPIVRIRDVTKTFGLRDRTVHALDHVSLNIQTGEVFGIIGYSGAGKSTLIRLLNALERPDSGSVVVDGREVTTLREGDMRRLRSDIGMIFQQFNLFNARSVSANVGYPLTVAGWPRQKRQARVAELLDFVGISEKAAQFPAQLSGGQKQRVGIARALSTSPKILLADEATSALDPETTRDVLDLLQRVNREFGITIILVTHEMSVVQHICQHVAVMENGQVVEVGEAYRVFSQPEHPATQRFIQTALHDRPAPNVLARLRERFEGRLVIASVIDRTAGGLRLTEVTDGLGVEATVVYGGLSEVEEAPFGSTTIELEGPDDGIEQAITRLRRTALVTDLGTRQNPRPDDRWPAASTTTQEAH